MNEFSTALIKASQFFEVARHPISRKRRRKLNRHRSGYYFDTRPSKYYTPPTMEELNESWKKIQKQSRFYIGTYDGSMGLIDFITPETNPPQSPSVEPPHKP